LTYNLDKKHITICDITPEFNIEDENSYFKKCSENLEIDLFKGKGQEDHYIIKIVRTDDFILGRVRKRGESGSFVMRTLILTGKYGRFENSITKDPMLKYVATNERKLFYIDQRSELAVPVRGFMKPSLIYSCKNKVPAYERSVRTDETITLEQGNKAELRF
jgi:hypothetical protein